MFSLALLTLLGGLWLQGTTSPTPEQVGSALSGLVVFALASIGAWAEQLFKKAVTPFNNAPDWVKAVLTAGWGYLVALIVGKVPGLGALLPVDPSGLAGGNFANGLILWLSLMGAHALGKAVGLVTPGDPAMPAARR